MCKLATAVMLSFSHLIQCHMPYNSCLSFAHYWLYALRILLLLHFVLGIPELNVLWWWPSVCLSVCLSLTAFPHYCMDPDVTLGNGRACPLVVHYRVGGFAISARLSLLWQYTRLMRNVSEDGCTRWMAGCYLLLLNCYCLCIVFTALSASIIYMYAVVFRSVLAANPVKTADHIS